MKPSEELVRELIAICEALRDHLASDISINGYAAEVMYARAQRALEWLATNERPAH